MEKKGEIEKAFALDERLSGRLDDSGEGTLGKYLTSAYIFKNIWCPMSIFFLITSTFIYSNFVWGLHGSVDVKWSRGFFVLELY